MPVQGTPNYLRPPGQVGAGDDEGVVVGARGWRHHSLGRTPFSFLYLGWVLVGGGCPPCSPQHWWLVLGTVGVPLLCTLSCFGFFFIV